MGLANYTPTSYKDIAPSDTLGLLPELTTAAAPTQAIAMDAVTEEFPLHALKQYDQLQQNVIDGDTIKGDQFGLAANVRLKGYNAPEMADKKYDDQTYIDAAQTGTTTPEQALGLEAKRDLINNTFTMQKVAGLAEAKDRKLLMMTEGYDKGGQRLLGGIYGTKDGKITDDISSRMLAEGDSNVWFEKDDPQTYEKSKLEKQLIDQALSKAQNSNDSNDWARYENLIQRSGLSKGEKDVYLNPDFLIAKPVANAVIGAGELTSKAGNLAIELMGKAPRAILDARNTEASGELTMAGVDQLDIQPRQKVDSKLLDTIEAATKAPSSKAVEEAFAPIREQLNQTFNTTIFSELRPAETASVAKAVHDWENGREGAGAIGIAKAVFNGLVNEENAAMLIPGAGMSLLILGKAKEFEDSGASKEKALAYGAMYTVLNKIGLNASLGQVKNLANLAAGRFATNAGLELLTENAQSLLELDAAGKINSIKDVEQSLRQTTLETAPSAVFGGTTGLVRDVVDGKDLKGKAAAKIQESIAKIREDKELEVPTTKLATDDISKLEEEVANVAGADFKNRLAASLTQAIQLGDEEAATRLTAVAKAYKEQIAATTQAATREDGTLSVKTLGSNPAALQAYFDSIAEAKDETVREELISKLINDKDLRDPEQYNMSEDQLKGYADVLRGSAAVANELNGIAATNSMIVDTGFATPAGVYEGMIEVFTKASNGDKSALAQANRFAGLQAQKQEALAAGVADAQEQVMSDVEAMARETKLSSDIVLQALAYLGNRTIKNNGANIKDETPFIKAAVAFMNARGAKIDTSANIIEQGKQAKAQYKGSALDKDLGKSYKFKYANPMGRNEGNYELNKFEVISDLQQAKMTEGTLVPTGISKLQAAVQAETNTINSAIEKVQGRQAKLNEILTAFTGVQTKQEPVVETAKEQVPAVETVEAPAEVKKPAKKVVKSKKQTIAQQISAATQAEPDTDKRTTIASTIMKIAKDANAEKDYYGSLSEEDLAEIERASKEAAPKPSTTVTIKVDESKLNTAGQKAVARLKKLAENGITPRLKVAYDKLMADVDSGLRGGRSRYVQQAIVKQARLDNKAYAKRVARNDTKEQARLTLQEAAAQEISKAGITNKSTAADIQKELSSRKQLRNATRQAINKTLEAAITTEDKAKVAKSIMADKAAVALDSAVIKQLEALLRSGVKAKELLKPSPVAGLTISNKKVPQGAIKAKPSINKIVEVDESSTEPLSSLGAAVLVDNDTLTRLVAEVEALNPANNASHNKEMVTQIAYGTPLIFSKGKGTANENVAVALHMAILNTLDEVSAELTTLDDEKISKLYGVEAVKNEAAKNQLKELGVPAKLIAERIGLDVLTLLGLKRKTSAEDSKELYSNLAVSLGLYAIELANNKGLIEVTEPTVKQIAAILGNEVTSDAVNYYIKMKSKNSGLLAAKEYDAINAQVGSNGQIRKDVKFTKPDLRKVKGSIRRSTLVKAPTEVVDAQKSYTAMPWKIKGLDGHKAMKEVLALGQAALMRAQGWLTADELSNISAERRDAVASKNEAIKRSVNALYRAAKKVSSGEEINEMWFDWFIAKNGRLMIDSAGLNPQGDKLHRHAMGIKGTESLVTKENEHVFKLGVAQAFGFDTDKKSTAASMKFAEQLLTKDGLEAIEKEWAKYLQELKTGGSTRKLKVQIGDNVIELKTEIISHTADGIEAVRQYVQADGKEFTTTLTLEMDGVTNGFALKVLQFATSLDKAFGKDGKTTAEEWMNKVGLEINNDGTEMAAKLESKVVDSYKTLAKQMTEKMLDKAARSIEEKYESVLGRNPDVVAKEVAVLSKALGALQDKNGVTKWARDIFKPPFMTFNYGAGFAKIREELGASIIDRLMTLVEADTHTDEMATLMKMLTGESTTEKAKEVLMTNRLDKIEYLDSNVRQHLEALIAVSYGKVVTDVMSAEFGDMVEANQHIMVGMKLVHRLWEISAKEELAKIAKAEGGLTIDAIERVYEALADKFPIIKGPLGDLSTGVAVFKTKLQESAKDGEPSPYGKGGAYVTRDGKSTTRSVARVAKMVTEAASAALVVPIHTLDAAIMSTATTDKNVLQVFDAIVTDISSAEAVAKDYNEKMLELSLSWNYVEEVYNTVVKAVEQADKATLAKVVEADQKSFKTIKESIKALRKLAEDNKKVKQELLQSKLTVEQMVLTKDGAYVHNGANTLEVLNKMLAEADIDTALKGCK